MCQVLPGGNGINLSVAVGARFQGPLGALAAWTGLLLAPFLILSALWLLYAQGTQFEVVRTALRGVASVAVGMLLGTGIKLALQYRREPWALAMGTLALVGVGVLRLPLVPVLVVLAPVSIALAWRRHR